MSGSEGAAQVAIVTGGATGIGLEVSRALADSGRTVVAFCLDDRDGSAFGEATGARGVLRAVDVSDPDRVEEETARIVSEHGRIDVLVNNAGIRDIGSALELPARDWQRVIDVNLGGTFFCSKAVGRVMAARGSGSIVNIASLASLIGFQRRTAYTASKHAILGLTRALAGELGPLGVRVNAICPGMIETPMTRAYVHEPVIERNIRGLVPLGHAGTPADIARAALFLAGDDSRYITGIALPVDGGFSATGTWDPTGESATFTRSQPLAADG
jgi:NAD(P)-dependent dehydrogenase (short-subunit alcohol dehydrogenase family)